MTIVVGADIETTGLLEPDQRIIEICAKIYKLEDRSLIKTWTQRIDPQRSINPKAQAVHGISSADLIGKPLWDEVAPLVQKILAVADIFVGHNGEEFDFKFIEMELRRLKLKVPTPRIFDTMKTGRWAHPLGKSPTLKELCFACGVDYDPALAHAAEYDVERMMDCFWFGLDNGAYQL